MNERFRFRAYDTRTGQYITDPMCITSEGALNAFRGGRWVCLQTSQDDCFKIEQCVGLKDKNGKLIYEGDIIRDEIAEGVVKLGNPDFARGSLTSMFYWQMTKHIDLTVFCFENDVFSEFAGVERIGNIHENPELLEVAE